MMCIALASAYWHWRPTRPWLDATTQFIVTEGRAPVLIMTILCAKNQVPKFTTMADRNITVMANERDNARAVQTEWTSTVATHQRADSRPYTRFVPLQRQPTPTMRSTWPSKTRSLVFIVPPVLINALVNYGANVLPICENSQPSYSTAR